MTIWTGDGAITNADHSFEVELLKSKANEELNNDRFQKSVDLYSKAIELDSSNAILYSNRSLAYFKLESYGLAIQDATRAIEIDPNYAKAYYRRASAFAAMFKPKDALNDFKHLAKLRSSDSLILLKLKTCQKVVQGIRFQEAIEEEETPLISDSLDLDRYSIDDSYDGCRISDSMSTEFLDDMISRFKNGKCIALKYACQIILETRKILVQEPTMNEVDIKDKSELIVVGDTHGQFFDLINIFETFGFPSDNRKYIFNGDFVDRGSWSVEVALLLFSLKWRSPNTIYLNRGNHETDDMNKVYGFEGECKTKYNERLFRLFSEAFTALPLSCLVAEQYLVVHGGLFSSDIINLDEIRAFNRHSRRQPGQSGIMMEMLWSDPQNAPGRSPSKRGIGLQFGPDVTKKFCEENHLKAVIRSHEVRDEGYQVEHDGKCITVFSAPNYCDQAGNKGAIVKITANYELQFHQFDAVAHPDIKPMAYASNLMMI